MMSGLRAAAAAAATAHQPTNLTSTRLPSISPLHNSNNLQPSLLTLIKRSKRQRPIQIRIRAQNGSNNKGLPAENGTNNSGDGEDDKVRPGFNLRWVDLLLDPDPNNVVAVGLTGLLTWASVQVLWQLFIISVAILIAALKYTLVAVVLVFILVTLL